MRRHALALALLLPSPLLAQDGPVSAGDPASVVAALQAQGHKARLETDDTGAPMISARGGDINYVVYFYGCEDGAGCLDLQFLATFDVETPLTADFANRYNSEWVMGKVWVDEAGDPTLTYVLAGDPPMDPAYFASSLDLWSNAVDSFLDEIDW